MRPSHRDQMLGELGSALLGVDGWFELPEAWALHETARTIRCPRPQIVEIGSFEGRSTISMGLGLKARGDEGGGQIVAIDPHDMEPGQYDSFRANLERAGVASYVNPVRSMSHAARPAIQDASVHLLFVDGSHDYQDVVQDIHDWESALAPGAVVAFNDPYWQGVSRAISDTILYKRSPFRGPRWVLNTLFFDYKPDAPWGATDEIMLRRVRAYLKLGRRWLDLHWKMVSNPRIPLWAKHAQVGMSGAIFSVILPRLDRGSRGLSAPAEREN